MKIAQYDKYEVDEYGIKNAMKYLNEDLKLITILYYYDNYSVKEISGGVKTLILMAFDDSGRIFNASACGNNCAKWILEIGKQKELIVNLRHIMDFGDNEFEIKILNKDQIVHNMEEFIDIAVEYV